MRYILIIFVFASLLSCNNNNKKTYRFYEGNTQGTSFHITYEWNSDLSSEIDSLLLNFDKSLSNYDPNSLISKINKNETNKVDNLVSTMLETGQIVYDKTDGAFDITVAPIVNAWGFGWIKHEKTNLPDSILITSLLKFVGMDKIRIEDSIIIKDNPETMIITNAIAQGLSVDYVSDYFFKLGLNNFLVEIGGEIFCFGKNNKGEEWRIGVDKPVENSNELNRENQIIINLSGKAIATSGNYRKFIANGKSKYGHSIDPRTGFPAKNELLSVSVISESCMLADAFATGLMVCGLEKALKIVENTPEIEAYFVYTEDDKIKSKASSGFKIDE